MHREYSNYGGYILLLPEAGSYKPAHSHQPPGFLLPPNASLRTLRLTGEPSHHLICCAYVGLCSLSPLLCSVWVVSVLIPYNVIRNTRSPFSNRSTYVFMFVYVCACGGGAWEARKGMRSCGAGVTGSLSTWLGCRKMTLERYCPFRLGQAPLTRHLCSPGFLVSTRHTGQVFFSMRTYSFYWFSFLSGFLLALRVPCIFRI